MTREEFSQMRFCAGDMIKVRGEWHSVCSVDFEEDLIAWDIADDDDDEMQLKWVRCESVEEHKPYKPSKEDEEC